MSGKKGSPKKNSPKKEVTATTTEMDASDLLKMPVDVAGIAAHSVAEEGKTYQAPVIEKMLAANKRWVDKITKDHPDYFTSLAKQQSPEILWIGCSDSRVPANQITGTQPGEIFVHRNIANLVVNTDMNMLSVLSYAVEVLKVKHVIVCGHYGCGGVLAAMGNKQFGLIDNWLRQIKDVYMIHRTELDGITDPTLKSRRLVELNVFEQVHDLCKTTIVQNAWKNGQPLTVHGWVYDIADGYIKDLKYTFTDNNELLSVYKMDL